MLERNLGNIGATLSKFADEVRKKEKNLRLDKVNQQVLYLDLLNTQSILSHTKLQLREGFFRRGGEHSGGRSVNNCRESSDTVPPIHLNHNLVFTV